MGEISWGAHSYGELTMTGGTFGKVSIGKYCSIGEGVQAFMSYDHNTSNLSTYPFGRRRDGITRRMRRPLPDKRTILRRHELRVVIGNDVFIGSHVVLFKDVVIGDGAVVGAYSVVQDHVPPYAIVAGNPAKVLRMRFPQDSIDFLLKLKWWDLNDKTVAEIAPLLCGSDIAALREWAWSKELVP